MVARPIDAANTGFAITPSDTVNFTYPVRGIYVGGGGDIAVVFDDDAETVLVFSAVPAGTTLAIKAKRVNATGTTATLMNGLA